jgi:glycosyltransferase involved in cell wall biosynthesis
MEDCLGSKSMDRKIQGHSLRVMHIVLNLDIGGAQEVVYTLAKYMARDGHKPVVCTFKDGPLRQEVERLGIPVEILPDRSYSIFALPLFLLEILRIRKELIRLIGKYHIDIVQTHLLQSLDFLVATLHFLTRSPAIYWTVHNYKFSLQEQDLPRFPWLLRPKRFLYRILYALCIYWIDGVIAVSDDVRKAILAIMGPVAEKKITTIFNGVDLERYQKSVSKRLVRESLGLDERALLVLVVAMLKEQKGHRYLLEAAVHVIPRFPHLHFLLVGDGILKEELRAQTLHLGLEENVHFLGIRQDIPDLLAESDYFVLPSLWEGLPMALIEAMASGLPIIATEVSGSKQLIEPGISGILIPPGDSQRLAEAICEIVSDRARAAEMGQAAQQRVRQGYSAGKQAKEHVQLYQQSDPMIRQLNFTRDFTEHIES